MSRADTKKLKSVDIDVVKVMRWYLTSNDKLRGMCMACGGVEDIVHDAVIKILSRRTARAIQCKWTTSACNYAKWTVLRQYHLQRRRQRAEYKKVKMTDFTLVAEQEQRVFSKEVSDLCERAVDELGTRYRRYAHVVRRVALDDVSMIAVADEMRVTRSRASQLYHCGIRKLQGLQLTSRYRLVDYVR